MPRRVIAISTLLWAQSASGQVRIEGLSERPPDRISIFTLRDEGITTPLLLFQETARQEVEAHLHAQIVSMDEMFSRGVVTYQAMVDCKGDAACFADLIGSSVGARYLLLIIASRIGDTRFVGARLVDLSEKRVVGESLEEVSGDFVEAVPSRIKGAVPADWWDPFGSLAVEIEEPGAQLLVNGIVVGMSPLGSLSYLLPGRYEVEAKKKGFLPAKGVATVVKGQEAKVVLSMEPEPEVGSSAWIIWVSVGAALVAGGATAAAVVLTRPDDTSPTFCTAPGGKGC